MLRTLDDSLALVAPHLPSELVSPIALQRIGAIAGRLPPLGMAGFECGLGTDEPGADFAVAVRPDAGDQAVLARWLGEGEPPPPSPDGRVWDRIRALCVRWADPDSTLYGALGTMWLEYDTSQGHTDCPIPNLLVGLEPEQRGDEAALHVACAALEVVTGHPLAASVAETLARCRRALCHGAALYQMGAMLSRDLPGVRLCVTNVDAPTIEEYLGCVDWPGSLDVLTPALRQLSGVSVRMALDLDLGAAVLPRIGIELYPQWQSQTFVDASWAAMLERLQALGICTPRKRDALLSWPGRTQARLLWIHTFLRGLNHVKLVYEPGGSLSAKAYFGFAQAPPGA